MLGATGAAEGRQVSKTTSRKRETGRPAATSPRKTPLLSEAETTFPAIRANGARDGIASDPKALKYSFFSVENFGKYQQVYHHELLMGGFDSNTQVCSGLALIELPQP
jgi:hypothetical protein